MMERVKLLEVYDTPRTNGIFYAMSQDGDFSDLFARLKLSDEDDFHAMDIDYILNHSGLKTLSVLLYYIYTGYVIEDDGEYCVIKGNKKVTWDYVLSQIDQDLIDTILKKRFLDKWNKLADTLELTYETLAPYSMKVTDTTGDVLESSGTNIGDTTETLKNEATSSRLDNTDRGVYGFNSEEEVQESGTDFSSKNESGSTDINQANRTTTDQYKRESNTTREISRTGNIGNHTNQELINEQRELLRYQIFDTIYSDLDSVLTRSKYI